MSIKHDVSVLCVISEPEYMDMCRAYGFNFVAFPNDPVGKKINSGIKYALEHYKFDYLMMMNSDTVINPKLFSDYYDELISKQVQFFGVNKVTFVNFYTDEAVEYEYMGSILGCGKMISRSLVERAFNERGKLYEPLLNRALDDTMYDNIMDLGVRAVFVEYEGQLVYDLKSDVNIHPWEKFANRGKKVTNELCSKAA
jgi:hypothetical protein